MAVAFGREHQLVEKNLHRHSIAARREPARRVTPATVVGRISATMTAVRVGGALAAACEIFLPALCLHCEAPLGGHHRGVCGTCLDAAERDPNPRCPRCGVSASDSRGPCLGCAVDPPPQAATVVGGDHSGPRRSMVVALKHGGRDDVARLLARGLSERILESPWHREVDVVVAIPSHPLHRLRRGHAASELLAHHLASDLARPRRRLLARRGLARQVGRTRRQRLALPRGRFLARSVGPGTGGVLLVDDVTTTGATLRRAAEALLQAGADTVWCAVAASAPDTRRIP